MLSAAVIVVAGAALLTPPAAQAFAISSFYAEVTAEGGAPATQAGSHPVALRMELELNEAGAGPFTRRRPARPRPRAAAGADRKPHRGAGCSQADFHTPRAISLRSRASRARAAPTRPRSGRVTLRSSLRRRRNPQLRPVQPRTRRPARPPSSAPTPTARRSSSSPRCARPTANTGSPWKPSDVSQLLDLSRIELTLWGTPWSVLPQRPARQLPERGRTGLRLGEMLESGARRRNPATAYLTLPTACEGPLAFTAAADSWQGGGRRDAAAQAARRSRTARARLRTATPGRRSQPPRLLALGLCASTSKSTTRASSNRTRRAPSPLRRPSSRCPTG